MIAFNRQFSGRRGAMVTVLVTGLLGLRQAYILLLPYWFDQVPYTLRADAFWAFSGGFVRRGLLGEVMYRISLLTGSNPSWIISAGLWCVYVIVVYLVVREIIKSAGWRTLLLIVCTPLLFNFRVDREILLLIPLVLWTMFPQSGNARLLGFILLPPIMLIHELAIIVYGPLLTAVCLSSVPRWRVSAELVTLMACLGTVALLTVLREAPSYALERVYWPELGVSGLEATGLYTFSNMSLGRVLELHLSWLRSYEGRTAVLLGIFFLGYLIRALYANKPLACCALVSIPPFFVLTVDYGRYIYFLFAFYVMADLYWRQMMNNREAGMAAFPDQLLVKGQVSSSMVYGSPLLWALMAIPVAYWAGEPGWPTPLRMSFIPLHMLNEMAKMFIKLIL